MKHFITIIKKLSVAAIYLCIWQVAVTVIHNQIIIAGPVSVLQAIIRILQQDNFMSIIGNSLTSIAIGFSLALVVSVVCAVAASHSDYVQMLLAPIVHIFKSVPVASFIILILIWMGSEGIARGISFIIVVPILYSGILQGLKSVDSKLVEMAEVFRMGVFRRMYYVYYLQMAAGIRQNAALAIGMCFKAGVAAEVIGVAKDTLGEQIYLSKIYLNTDELFGWTILIMILAYGMEQVVKLIFHMTTYKALRHGG